MFYMEYIAIVEALDGLFAYDSGCVDSGVKDPGLRAKVFAHIQGLDKDAHRRLIARLTTDMWLSDDALTHGYGAEDAQEFLQWLDDNGLLISA